MHKPKIKTDISSIYNDLVVSSLIDWFTESDLIVPSLATVALMAHEWTKGPKGLVPIIDVMLKTVLS